MHRLTMAQSHSHGSIFTIWFLGSARTNQFMHASEWRRIRKRWKMWKKTGLISYNASNARPYFGKLVWLFIVLTEYICIYRLHIGERVIEFEWNWWLSLLCCAHRFFHHTHVDACNTHTQHKNGKAKIKQKSVGAFLNPDYRITPKDMSILIAQPGDVLILGTYEYFFNLNSLQSPFCRLLDECWAFWQIHENIRFSPT